MISEIHTRYICWVAPPRLVRRCRDNVDLVPIKALKSHKSSNGSSLGEGQLQISTCHPPAIEEPTSYGSRKTEVEWTECSPYTISQSQGMGALY
jgi:hypothetical protein